MKAWLRGLLAALINGAATGASTYVALPPAGQLPEGADLKIVGSAAMAGAIFGGISYILRSPMKSQQ